MMHAARSNNPRTGTVIFQVDDRSLDYLERLIGCEVEFQPLAEKPVDYEREILQTILGGIA
jgi:hypothetical protein